MRSFMSKKVCSLCGADIDKHVKGDVTVLTLEGKVISLDEWLKTKKDK